MKLRTIASSGLKGRDFKYDLAPATVFTGPSFSGKTAVLDAVKVALLGYHPKLGKRPGDVLQLSSGNGMKVILTFDDGDRIERMFGRGLNATKKEEPFMQPAMLDVGEYFAMSGPARMAYVLANMPLPSLDGADPDAAVVKAIQSITVEDSDAEDVEAAVKEAVMEARKVGAARVEEDATIGEWLELLLARMKELGKESDTAMKQFAGLAQGTTQLSAAAQAAPARSVEAQLKAAAERRDTLKVELNTLQAALQTNKAHEERIAWLEKELSVTMDFDSQIKTIEGAIAELEKQQGVQPVDPMTAYRKMMECQEQIGLKTAEANRLRVELDRMEKKHSENMQLECCPFCKSKKKGWQEGIVEEHKAKVAENALLRGMAEGDTRKLAEAKEKAEQEYQKLKGLHDAFTEAGRVLNSERKRLDSLRTQAAATAQYRTELKTRKESRPPAADGFRVPELETEIRLAQTEVDRLDGEQRKFISEKAKEAQVLKANAAHAKHKARLAVFKGAVEAVRELQATILNRVFTGMMDTVNLFTNRILRAPLQFRDGDIGYERDGKWVSHSCFSGTEEAVAYAGICVALAAKAPMKLVVIDELGIIDDITKDKVLRRLVELVKAGVIDQFLGADVSNPAINIDGLTTIPVA